MVVYNWYICVSRYTKQEDGMRNNKLVAIRMPIEKVDRIKQYLRERSVIEQRDISLSEFIREMLDRALKGTDKDG